MIIMNGKWMQGGWKNLGWKLNEWRWMNNVGMIDESWN
jgi:hypothetical protein